MTPERQVADAQRLKELLKEPVVAEALKRIEDRYDAAFRAPNLKPEEVQAAYARVRALQDLLTEFKSVFDSGMIAQAQMDRQAELAERQKAAAERRQPRR